MCSPREFSIDPVIGLIFALIESRNYEYVFSNLFDAGPGLSKDYKKGNVRLNIVKYDGH